MDGKALIPVSRYAPAPSLSLAYLRHATGLISVSPLDVMCRCISQNDAHTKRCHLATRNTHAFAPCLAPAPLLHTESFFKLHDLDQNGILSRSELEAIYGLHHESSKKKSGSDEEHRRKTDEILAKVLAVLDQNGDGVVTKTEFVAAGEKGLPEFSHHEGLGHHYDSEGEYFLVSAGSSPSQASRAPPEGSRDARAIRP